MGLFHNIFKIYLNGVLYNLNNQREFYLGPHIFPQWALALLPFARLFNGAAFQHDLIYAGKKFAKSRFDADKAFLRDCLSASRTLSGVVRVVAVGCSYFYFVVVRMYGRLFYKGGGAKW
jgi:hypothetical protein